MPMGINNITVITMNNITEITNSSSLAEFMVKGNEIMFGGVAFFLLLLALWLIMFMASQQVSKARGEDNVLVNLMISSAITTILSIIVRGIEVYVYGVKKGLITDKLLWIFPLFTILIGTFLYMTKD